MWAFSSVCARVMQSFGISAPYVAEKQIETHIGHEKEAVRSTRSGGSGLGLLVSGSIRF